MIEFASALAAVNSAVEIQDVLARRNVDASADRLFQVRIGIHLGDVLPRGDDIVGDGVNIAARIEPLADSGGIAVTQQVFDQVYNKIPQTLARIGKVELKNIQRPVEVYRIVTRRKTHIGGRRPAHPVASGGPIRPQATEIHRRAAVREHEFRPGERVSERRDQRGLAERTRRDRRTPCSGAHLLLCVQRP